MNCVENLKKLAQVLDVKLTITWPCGIPDEKMKWRASLETVEIKEGQTSLASAVAFGIGTEHALGELWVTIRGKVLVIDAMSKNRREIFVPELYD